MTGAVFHLLMVFSYPILAASAVAATGAEAPPVAEPGERPGRGYWLPMRCDAG